MKTIEVDRTIDSTTVTIPELHEFIGQTVEITVRPKNPLPIPVTNGRGWDALLDLMNDPGDYDFDAVVRQREYDRAEARKQSGLE